MAVTQETIQFVLRSWIAIEVLTSQTTKDGGWNTVAAERGGRLRNRNTDAQDGPSLWRPPQDQDLPPWPLLPDPPPRSTDEVAPATEAENGQTLGADGTARQDRLWYSIILGVLPARDAFARLDAVFKDKADEDQIDRPMSGHVIAASVWLDEWGVMVPDSLAVASFAWGLGHMLSGGAPSGLSGWQEQEKDIKAHISDLLTPLGKSGQHRSLTWNDLRGASLDLAGELEVPEDLWIPTPCAIETIRRDPPEAEILSSFCLPDLAQVLRNVATLPVAVSSYLGLNPPADTWDALSDRQRLSKLLEPALFPLTRWPGPGLHPLTLLQQAAVNAIVRDLKHEGLAAVNGPPGTGKTTLLRDLVAHIMVTRAEKLASIENPAEGLGSIDLMDFAIVVASCNNAAVENISLELPVREKALDPSVWKDGGLDYFGQTATHLLDLPAGASEDKRAWGLIAARLGKADNRRRFFQRFWWDEDWGLNDWLNRVAWPDAPHHRERPLGKLARLDPPPRGPEARAHWQWVRGDFQRALKRCRRLRSSLDELAHTAKYLHEVEAKLPVARAERERIGLDLQSAQQAAATAREQDAMVRIQSAAENTKLAALMTIRPSALSRLLRTRAWQSHEAGIREQLSRLNDAQQATEAAKHQLTAATAEEQRQALANTKAESELAALETDAADLSQRLKSGGVAVQNPGLWGGPDAMFHRSSPWNEGQFREARDTLFAAAIRLHRAFFVAGARTLKPSLNAIAKATLGGSDVPKPTAQDWGVFFLLVPVVSTTFASIGRMFQTMGASDIGWLLIDEAGQAPPQHAVGAIWRARRAVVIGDPLQIEPVAAMPRRTARLICQSQGVDPTPWIAPQDSAQTLADRASQIQGHFPIEDGGAGKDVRITGMPLLVHRRCEQPMFDLSNRIAYANRMIFATAASSSSVRDLLGNTAWVDVDAPSTEKWVQAEGALIARAIAGLCAMLPLPPDLYVISPFRMPAFRLRRLLLQTPTILAGRSLKEREDWIEKRVGTVHTFQGKEAEAVILMLGAGRGAKPGSRNWAGSTPNLLNVAATRARRSLYIVGNRNEWQGAGVFSQAASMLDVRKPDEWLIRSSLSSAS
jgi:AAA domain